MGRNTRQVTRKRGARAASVALLAAALLAGCGEVDAQRSGDADHLAFVVGPRAGVTGSVLAPAVVVALVDARGDLATAAAASVTLSIHDGPQGATLGGERTIRAEGGLAKFTDLFVDRPGRYVLEARVPALPPVVGAPIDVALVAAASLHLAASADVVVAGEEVTLTVTALDPLGNRASGHRGDLVLSSTDPAAVLPAGVRFDDGAEGQVRIPGAVLYTAGPQTLTAVDPREAGLTASAPLEVLPGTPSPSVSEFHVEPTMAPADGVTPVEVRATIRNEHGVPISGVSVALSSTGAGHVFSSRTGVTGADGAFSAELTSTVPETKTVTAAIGAGELVLNGVAVFYGDPDAAASILGVTPPTAAADGRDAVQVTVVVRDAARNPVPGVHVAFAATPPGSALTPEAERTDASGLLRAVLRSSVLGVVTVAADVDHGAFRLEGQVTFTDAAVITGLSPERGPTGGPLVIEGAGFGEAPGAVTVGGLPAEVKRWSDGYLVVLVPGGLPAGPAAVVVDAPGRPRAGYEVLPWIRKIEPPNPAPGSIAEVRGSSFGHATGRAILGDRAIAVLRWDTDRVEVQIPRDASGPSHFHLETADGLKTNRYLLRPRGTDTWIPFDEAQPTGTAVWTGTQMIVWGGDFSDTGSRYDPVLDAWTPTAGAGAPTPRSGHQAVWTGREMIVWGGYSRAPMEWTDLNTGARYDPETDAWRAMSDVGAPTPRASGAVVWTGSEMIVWGGTAAMNYQPTATGARYDPASDTWRPVSTVGAPSARPFAQGVWTGREMIVWGGGRDPGGARYDPATDTWRPMSTAGAPTPQLRHAVVWTGQEMLVWGDEGPNPEGSGTGARYDPASDTWHPMETSGAPAPRTGPSAVWTGQELVVFGGSEGGEPAAGGARYDPVTDRWSPLAAGGAPALLSTHRAVWTGLEMLVWGADLETGVGVGGRYRPDDDAWTRLETHGTPPRSSSHTAVWTGTEMIVWGGWTYPSTGHRYDPAADRWTTVETAGAPAKRRDHTAVWTGTEMIVWGGEHRPTSNDPPIHMDTGGRYDPRTDSWRPVSEAGAPSGRDGHTAIWTGTEMIVWGGGDQDGPFQTGGRYDPRTDTWTPTTLVDAPPAMIAPTAVWTGTEMIVSGQGIGHRYDPLRDRWTPTAPGAPEISSRHTAVWTGTEMIVWGYSQAARGPIGARYHPGSDTWMPVSTADAPAGRSWHTAVWTGRYMVVWGGVEYPGTAKLDSGGRYDPVSDTWEPTSMRDAPRPRTAHTAVWTGTEMLIWGGHDPYLADWGARYLP